MVEIWRLMGVTIWGKRDSLLLSGDRFVNIGNVTETLKPTTEGDPEVRETSGLVGMTIRTKADSLLLASTIDLH